MFALQPLSGPLAVSRQPSNCRRLPGAVDLGEVGADEGFGAALRLGLGSGGRRRPGRRRRRRGRRRLGGRGGERRCGAGRRGGGVGLVIVLQRRAPPPPPRRPAPHRRPLLRPRSRRRRRRRRPTSTAAPLPPAAKAHSKAGAEAFVRAYFAEVNRAWTDAKRRPLAPYAALLEELRGKPRNRSRPRRESIRYDGLRRRSSSIRPVDDRQARSVPSETGAVQEQRNVVTTRAKSSRKTPASLLRLKRLVLVGEADGKSQRSGASHERPMCWHSLAAHIHRCDRPSSKR